MLLGLIWGQISVPFQFKNEQKLPKMVYIILNFVGLHFCENVMKIRTKIPKMHEKLQKNVNQVFPILRVKMPFFQIQQAPDPDFRKVGMSLRKELKEPLIATKDNNFGDNFLQFQGKNVIDICHVNYLVEDSHVISRFIYYLKQ